MPLEPSCKRVFVFIDGQNLFHQAKAAFGYPFPNYDPTKLASHIYDVALILSQDQDLSEAVEG